MVSFVQDLYIYLRTLAQFELFKSQIWTSQDWQQTVGLECINGNVFNLEIDKVQYIKSSLYKTNNKTENIDILTEFDVEGLRSDLFGNTFRSVVWDLHPDLGKGLSNMTSAR